MKPFNVIVAQPKHSAFASLWLIMVLLSAPDTLASGKITRIDSLPCTIEAPGNYLLANDMQYDGPAIFIDASGVDLDLGGNILSGKDKHGVGVCVDSQANVRIHNGTIRGFTVGVDLRNTVDCALDHLVASQNGFSGLVANRSTDLTVARNTANDNGTFGIFINDRCTASQITRNIANENEDTGIFVGGDSFANAVTENTAEGNRLSGISIFVASNNTVTDNLTINNGDRGLNLVTAADKHRDAKQDRSQSYRDSRWRRESAEYRGPELSDRERQ